MPDALLLRAFIVLLGLAIAAFAAFAMFSIAERWQMRREKRLRDGTQAFPTPFRHGKERGL